MGRKPTKHLTPTQAEAARILRRAADEVQGLTPKQATNLSEMVRRYFGMIAATSGRGWQNGLNQVDPGHAARLSYWLKNSTDPGKLAAYVCKYLSDIYENWPNKINYAAALALSALAEAGHLKTTTKSETTTTAKGRKIEFRRVCVSDLSAICEALRLNLSDYDTATQLGELSTIRKQLIRILNEPTETDKENQANAAACIFQATEPGATPST